MGVKTMFQAVKEQPYSEYSISANLAPRKTGYGLFNAQQMALLRDNFSVPTWLIIGCLLQCLLNLVLPRSFGVVPALLYLAWGVLDRALISAGLKKNIWREGVVDGKFSVAYPSKGERTLVKDQPADNGPGAVMILGTISNSPLGMFAPGFKEVGDRFREMIRQVEGDPSVSGFMGMSAWLSISDRATNNQYATISYWRSIEDIHQFALSPIHRDAWNWWNKTIKEHPHIGIMHEMFEIPMHNGWEGIYVNYQRTGLAATTRAVDSGQKGEGLREWIIPIVDASRGVYRSSKGRMAKGDTDGSSNDGIAPDAYTG